MNQLCGALNKYETGEWCPGAESNHRHRDFQSRALPTELPGRRPPDVAEEQSARVIKALPRTVQNAQTGPRLSRLDAERGAEPPLERDAVLLGQHPRRLVRGDGDPGKQRGVERLEARGKIGKPGLVAHVKARG